MLIDKIMEDTSLWRAYNKKIDLKFAPNAGFAVLNLSYLQKHQYLSRSVPMPADAGGAGIHFVAFA
jgi:hypothetical protein